MFDDVMKGEKIALMDGALKKYNADVNLKAFYKELHDWLVEHDFVDSSFDFYKDIKKKKGEFENNDNLTRNEDYFEKKFVIIKKPDGGAELEIVWEAKTKALPITNYGKVFFKLDLSVRNWNKKEFLDENNQKKVLDSGGWEFRNKLEYQNTVVEDFLSTVPIVKNSDRLKELYLKSLYMNKVEEEVEQHVIPKILETIQGIIEKHFT